LQAQSSSFLKINPFVLIIFLSLTLTQCKAESIWGVPLAAFRSRLQAQETEFLRDLETENIADANKLGAGAPYYLSLIFSDLGRQQTADRLLVLQLQRRESPWWKEAGLLLLQRHLHDRTYDKAEFLARELLLSAGGMTARTDKEFRYSVQRSLVEALYWQAEDEEVLQRLADLRTLEVDWDDELDLFHAVSACRLDINGWQERFEELFFQRRTSSLHSRALSFLEQEQRLDAFSPAAASFFRAKDLLYRGQSWEALVLLEAALAELALEKLDTALLIAELGAAYFSASAHEQGAAYLRDLSARLPPAGRLEALEMAGRLYRKVGAYNAALALFDEVIQKSDSSEQRDRVIWFSLDIARTRSLGSRPKRAEFLDGITRLAALWHDPDYFSDILETEISRIVAQRAWSELLVLYRALRGRGPRETLARAGYLLGRASSLDLPAAGSAGDLSAEGMGPRSLFLEARDNGGQGYYGALASAVLQEMGIPARWPGVEGQQGEKIREPAPGQSGRKITDREKLIRGYFEYGLYEFGYRIIQAEWRDLPAEFIFEAAGVLHRQKEVLTSIRLMNLYLLRKQADPSRAELEMLYPRAFGEAIGELAAAEDLSAALFFALVREESHFDPRIVSRSGAVGLTQLMPQTAEDMARRLRLPDYDLQDPEQNLRLGAGHFSRLLARLQEVPKALMAYNAGLSRLRSWERGFSGLPTDLLVEALPYPETRNYIRKILVSAVYYGKLYYDQSLEETVFHFFPGLEETMEESP